MQNKIIAIVLGAIAIAGLAFFGGMKFGQTRGVFNGGMPPGGETTFGGPGLIDKTGSRQGQGSGLIGGEIISLGDKSVTIKMPDGGSQTVYWSDSTEITKSTVGTSADLVVGVQVMVTGTEADGVTTAQSIQIK